MPSLYDQLAASYRGGYGSQFDALASPLDDASLLSRIGGSAVSGLGWLGEVLQKPDRILYALPSGNPRELLNLVPFSDAIGLTDPGNMASASTALEYAGLLPENTPGFDWWDPIRLGADIVGSPSTYFSFGGSALTKAGEVAQAAGLLDDVSRVGRMTGSLGKLATADNLSDIAAAAAGKGVELADVLDGPLAGMGRVSIPFTNVGTTFGFGPMSQSIAGTLDTAGDLIARTPVVGPTLDALRRGGRMLFDPSAGNRFLPDEQRLAGLAYAKKPAAMAAARSAEFDAIETWETTYKAFDEAFGEGVRSGLDHFDDLGDDVSEELARRMTRDVFDKIVRFTGETEGDVGNAWERMMRDTPMPNAELADGIIGISKQMQGANRTLYDSLRKKGAQGGLIEDIEGFAHLPRYVDKELAKDFTKLRGQRLAKTSFPGAQARADEIRTLPADVVNELLGDEAARGAEAIEHIAAKYGRYLGKEFEGGKPAHAAALASWISEHAPTPLFGRRLVDDFFDYQRHGHLASTTIDAIHEIARQSLGTEGVALNRAYSQAGLDAAQALEYLAAKTGKSASQLAGMKIPADVAAAMKAVIQPWQAPEWAQMLGDTLGKFNGWFRKHVTLPFASFAARNFGSGQHVNIAASGVMHTASDLADYGRAFAEAGGILKNPGANKEIIRELWEQGLTGSRIGAGFEDVETFVRGTEGALTPGSPLRIRQTATEAAANVASKPSFLDRVPGGKAARKVGATWMGTGAKLNQNVEFMNRVPLFLYLRKKGWSPLAAAKKVNEVHFDYGDLTAAERGIRNTLVPFYTFQRKAGPLILKNLVERPGGGVAQSIRATNFARGDREQAASTPDYVSSTTAIPLGELADGSKRFITGLGLAQEVPTQFLGGGLQGALLEGASQLSPLVKAPLEWMTGQSFFQRGPGGAGRSLESTDPTIARILANVSDLTTGEQTGRLPKPGFFEFAVANSPLSRYASTARQLTDTRKDAIDKLMLSTTGLRFTDVSPAAQEAILRERSAELMKDMGARTFAKTYFDKDTASAMPPEERAQAEKLNALQRFLARKASARARLAEAAQ